jgi:hypothetical protein
MPARLSVVVAGGLLVLLTGCSDPGATRLASRPTTVPDNVPPVIDPTQLAYDPDQRTLHLYELIADPKTGRKGTWEVWLSDRTVAYPTEPTFKVPRGVPESGVVIKAADPLSLPSAGVRLADVPRKKR